MTSPLECAVAAQRQACGCGAVVLPCHWGCAGTRLDHSRAPWCACPQEQFRRAAIACLAQRVQVSLASAAQQASAETEQLLETQAELAQRGAHLQAAVRLAPPQPSYRIRQRHKR